MDSHITVAVAVTNHAVLTLTYDNKVRIVEPHTTGLGSESKVLLRAYQTAPEAGWRLFDLARATDVQATSVKFSPRLDEGYRSDDSGFTRINAQV
jgi:hypothetical protein